MLKEIRLFLNQEKLYSYLLIASIVIYSLFLVFSEQREYESPAMAKMKAAQEQFGEHAEAKKTLEEFFKEDRWGALFVTYSFLVLFLFFCLGFIMSIVAMIQKLRYQTLIKTIYTPENISWNVGDVIKVMILFVFFSIGTGMGLGIVNQYLFNDSIHNVMLIVHTTITDMVILFLIVYFVTDRHKHSLKSIGLNTTQVWNDIVLGVVCYSVILPILIIVIGGLSYLVQLTQYEPPPHPLVDIFVVEEKTNPTLIYCSIILACTIGPIIEEIFFRGFCYNAIKKKWGVRAAMIITAAFFAIIHQSTFSFVPIFMLGIILAYLYERRGTLIPSITLHVLHNSLFIGYFFVLKRVFLDRVGQ